MTGAAGICLAWLFVLGACSDDDGEGSSGMPATAAGTPGRTSAGTGVAQQSGAGTSAGARGMTAAGTGASGMQVAGAEAAGTGGTGGMETGGSEAAGAMASAGTDGTSGDAGAAPQPEPRPAAVSLDLPTIMEYPDVEPWFNVYRPQDLGATGEPLPVIVWANGGCFRSDFTWEPLFNRWAAGGFVVLALTESPTAGALAQTSVAEQGALIDWALEQAEYKEMLDADRVIAAGNSCGGITALGLAAEDPRVAAVFVLSGSSNVGAPNLSVINAIEVPVGYVVGGAEDIAGANATGDYDALADGVPAMIVSRSSGDHVTVSTTPEILEEEAEIALNWMDLAVFGTPEAYDALTSDNVCASCSPGMWTLKSKSIEMLQR